MKKIFFVCFLFSTVITAFAQNYTIQQYLNIKSANSPTFSADGKKLAYLSNDSGLWQIWMVDLAESKPRMITSYEDNIGFVKWSPAGTGIVFGKAHGGDENTQLFWMANNGIEIRELTKEPKVRHNFGAWSEDGRTIYYASNKRNPTFFDIYSMDVVSGKETLLYQYDGNNDFSAVNGAGNKIIVSRDGTELSLDNNLYLVDLALKKETLLTPHTGSAEFGHAHFVADGIVYTHNDNREFISLAQMRKKNASGDDWSEANRAVAILDDAKWDVDDLEMGQYGSTMAYTLNREGFSDLYLRKYETDGKPLITVVDKAAEQIRLPAEGIVSGLTFNKDQSKLAFSFSSAAQNGDIWVYDLKAKTLAQATHSDRAGIDEKSFVAPELVKFKTFDGRDIPGWYYRPQVNFSTHNGSLPVMTGKTAVTQNLSVIVSVHGGPEGQERPGFNPLYQYYLSRGYAILAPNVRGSTGYGKTYTHLDDVQKREDTLKDLAHATKWLRVSGSADPKKIAIMGGSYGGYMTLAAITLNPDLWAAAVDTVGISNWETFLKNTSGYRRRQREVEYGRLDRDIDFLRSISPINKIDRIQCPLFVIAGKNDPRVPWTEGQQMVDALKKRGAIVQWKLYDDEGHGVAKLKNRLELYPLVADFLDKYMK